MPSPSTLEAAPPTESGSSSPPSPSSFYRRLIGTRPGGVVLLVTCSLLLSLATRLALLAKSAGDVTWDWHVPAAFLCGSVFDFAFALWWAGPLALIFACLPRRIFSHGVGKVGAHLFLLAGIYLLFFTAVAEWVFWDEFGARFNFIAVDYLVYTTEVIGNIRESYPMPLIFGGVLVVSAGVYAAIVALGFAREWLSHADQPFRSRIRTAGLLFVATLAVSSALTERMIPSFENNYTHELAKSGPWSLFAAFRANQLDYDRFYPTIPIDAAFKRVHAKLAASSRPTGVSQDEFDLQRRITAAGPEMRLNVIQITVESLSASFLGRYGNTEGLTPNLDALMPKSLVFDQLYATGNRTDRGMEALTLSVPPTPGRSLVKRPQNEHLFTLGSVFRNKGYETAFIYGGFGYFDNMNYFFGQNGYRVVDRAAVSKSDVTFANVWGACDEDLFRWTLREADKDYAQGKPFSYFVMTTSNHRPFTFPEGKIDLPSKNSGRRGGVKYTDYAIGELLRQAFGKPWFRNTVFVIVADHCASSAGRTELPVQNYHIPLIIYAPGGQIQPGMVQTLASQIDYSPTLLGLLNWSYDSRFFGNDLRRGKDNPQPRAFVANYQKLGLLQGGKLAVLKPIRDATTFAYDFSSGAMQQATEEPGLTEDAIAYYQAASYLFKHHKQNELPAEVR